jgi:4-hydroxy-2-oxoheptanedioate aldolase
MKNIKESVRKGEKLIGTIIVSSSPVNVEISGYLKYDFVLIDSEHARTSPYETEMENLIRAADAADITPVVRITGNDLSQAKKAIDFGAKGVICPFINNKEDAKRLVDACFYPPLGNKGGAPVVRATQYGVMPWYKHVDQINENLIIMPIIERLEAIKNLDEIFSVKGINSVLLGPFDLAIELGVRPKGTTAVEQTLGMLTDNTVVEYMNKITEAAHRKGVAVANIAWSAEDAINNFKRGVDIVGITGDNNMFVEIAKRYIETIRNGIK